MNPAQETSQTSEEIIVIQPIPDSTTPTQDASLETTISLSFDDVLNWLLSQGQTLTPEQSDQLSKAITSTRTTIEDSPGESLNPVPEPDLESTVIDMSISSTELEVIPANIVSTGSIVNVVIEGSKIYTGARVAIFSNHKGLIVPKGQLFALIFQMEDDLLNFVDRFGAIEFDSVVNTETILSTELIINFDTQNAN